MKLRRVIGSLGWDGAFLAVCSVVAIVLGILDFLPQLQLTGDPILRVVLSFVGLLLGAVAAQATRRRTEILEMKMELKDAIGVAEVELLPTHKEFGQHLVPSILKAKQIVWDTVLNRVWPAPGLAPHFSGDQAEYKRLLYERVSRGEIGFRRVEVVFNRVSLGQIVQRLLIHEGFSYYIRYYKAPPVAIPIVNLMSFDGEAFYFGGFHTGTSPGADPVLYIRDPKLARIYKSYWNALWNDAIPLNEGRVINWEQIRRIGSDLGLTDEKFDEMVSQVKTEVLREKRRLRLR